MSILTTRGRLPGWARYADVPIVMAVLYLLTSLTAGNIQFLAATMAIYALFAMATNMLVGWLGVMTFGQAAFFGGGAYFVAICRDLDLSPPVLVALAGLTGAVMAALFALVTLRISGIALTMLTLVFGQILHQVTFSIEGLRGDDGIPGVPAGTLFGMRLARPEEFWLYAVVVVGLCIWAIKAIHLSSFGRSVVAARDDRLRAEALGAPVRSFRTTIIVLAGFFSAVAGGLFAQHQGIVTPESLHWLTSGNVLIMCLLGGIRSFWGPVIGAALLLWLDTQLFSDIPYASLFVGLILLAVVLVFRGGVAGLPAQVRSAKAQQAARRAQRSGGRVDGTEKPDSRTGVSA